MKILLKKQIWIAICICKFGSIKMSSIGTVKCIPCLLNHVQVWLCLGTQTICKKLYMKFNKVEIIIESGYKERYLSICGILMNSQYKFEMFNHVAICYLIFKIVEFGNIRVLPTILWHWFCSLNYFLLQCNLKLHSCFYHNMPSPA